MEIVGVIRECGTAIAWFKYDIGNSIPVKAEFVDAFSEFIAGIAECIAGIFECIAEIAEISAGIAEIA
jgi:hypothetical protein